MNFKIVKIDYRYCDYLRKFDNKVAYNKDKKELRPFLGILFTIEECEYFAPLTSPKEKHKEMKNTLDFLKIQNGKLGAINFNNMIPVKEQNYKLIELNNQKDTYEKLLKEQLEWLNENKIQIRKKSLKLYKMNIENILPERIASRCCDFKLLEIKCNEYNEKT